MNNNLNEIFEIKSTQTEFEQFIDDNPYAIDILNKIQPQLAKHFPKSEFSLKVCNDLEWTTEEKLLINVHVDEETFFNGILDRFNDIYEKIDPLIQDDFCPVVLFPQLLNEKYEKMSSSSVINLVARTSYFNGDFDKNLLREMSIRDIPKKQRKNEIVEYCKIHPNPDFSDIIFDLQLDIFDVDEVIDELGLEVRY
jgi:hypothetical protein